jgi:nucleotide-binding universal stress UspA family protein
VASALHDAAELRKLHTMANVEANDNRRDRAAFRHIVVPTDLTERTTRAVDLALQLASGRRPRVSLVHVIQTVPGLAFGDLEPFYRKLQAKADKQLSAMARETAGSGVEVDVRIAYGPRAETIIKTATACKADLIVLASHRVNPSAVGRDWGTISYKVGLLARCPVLLVK